MSAKTEWIPHGYLWIQAISTCVRSIFFEDSSGVFRFQIFIDKVGKLVTILSQCRAQRVLQKNTDEHNNVFVHFVQTAVTEWPIILVQCDFLRCNPTGVCNNSKCDLWPLTRCALCTGHIFSHRHILTNCTIQLLCYLLEFKRVGHCPAIFR